MSASLVPACAMVHPPPPTEATAALPAGASKVAVMLMVVDTIQAPVPLHPPPFHPANREPALGVAVNVTVVPPANGSLQSPPQLIPAGIDVTDPRSCASLSHHHGKRCGKWSSAH